MISLTLWLLQTSLAYQKRTAYSQVLQRLDIKLNKMVMSGYNYKRDTSSATGIGVLGNHLVENGEYALDLEPVKTTTLKMIKNIVKAKLRP
jgi:hypothetical protein